MEKQAFFGLRIQILDDNPFYTTLFKTQLEHALGINYAQHVDHFKVQAYTDPLPFLKHFPAFHSVSFLDYHLGTQQTGIDVLYKIKQKTPFAKVYMVTDEENCYILRTCLEAGADGIIFKNQELLSLSLLVIQQTVSNPVFPYQFNGLENSLTNTYLTNF